MENTFDKTKRIKIKMSDGQVFILYEPSPGVLKIFSIMGAGLAIEQMTSNEILIKTKPHR